LIFVVAFLGALSGQNWKWLRRYIIPLLVTIYAYFLLQNWWVLSCYLMAFPLSLGYGIPEIRGFNIKANENYKIIEYDDKGSAIGRFFYRVFHNSELWANVFTRGTVGLLISLTMLSIPILTGKWFSYFAGSQNIIGIWALLSWRRFGSIPVKLFGKTYTLLNVDLTCYAVTACGILTIIHGWLG